MTWRDSDEPQVKGKIAAAAGESDLTVTGSHSLQGSGEQNPGRR